MILYGLILRYFTEFDSFGGRLHHSKWLKSEDRPSLQYTVDHKKVGSTL